MAVLRWTKGRRIDGLPHHHHHRHQQQQHLGNRAQRRPNVHSDELLSRASMLFFNQFFCKMSCHVEMALLPPISSNSIHSTFISCLGLLTRSDWRRQIPLQCCDPRRIKIFQLFAVNFIQFSLLFRLKSSDFVLIICRIGRIESRCGSKGAANCKFYCRILLFTISIKVGETLSKIDYD